MLNNTIAKTLNTAAADLGCCSPSPMLDAEVLLAFRLNKPRSYFRAWREKPLEAAEIDDFLRLVARRRAGEPVAYITGTREFWSRRAD